MFRNLDKPPFTVISVVITKTPESWYKTGFGAGHKTYIASASGSDFLMWLIIHMTQISSKLSSHCPCINHLCVCRKLVEHVVMKHLIIYIKANNTLWYSALVCHKTINRHATTSLFTRDPSWVTNQCRW